MSHTLLWLTDVHLNFLESDARKKFYQKVANKNPDTVLITGDIAEAVDLCELLTEFSLYIDKTIFFVLGNHDYYRGSVNKVRDKIQFLCKNNQKLIWLGRPEIIKLSNETILVGHDTWADSRNGDVENSTVNLNDCRYIAELISAASLGKSALKKEMQRLADVDAAVLKAAINKAIQENNPKKIIIAIHVPPFKECCQYKGKQSDENWQPYFSSKITGDVISAAAEKYPDISFLVLCGHTHSKHVFKPYENLEIKTGGAEYYRPKIQEIIEINSQT